MESQQLVSGDAQLATAEVGTRKRDGVHLVWCHGWGQSAAALLPLAETLKPFASSSLLDFPGFGKSPKPPDFWGTAEYADFVAGWMRTLEVPRIVWIGHSFGGRVGIQLAARHPDLIQGLVLIASAGLPRKRTLWERVRVEVRKRTFKIARLLLPEGPLLERLRRRMGSRDYRNAGALRPILTRVVSEDLTNPAKAVRCPTLLIYGDRDTETPPDMGQRFNALIAGSELVLLDGFDHLTVLTEGRHQLVLRIRKFLELLNR
jgi:pimeloyl-ACP methyl ester carboxylesterase